MENELELKDLTFRVADTDDLDAIHAIRREAILGVATNHFSSEALQSWADKRSPEYFAQRVEEDAVLIVESDSDAVAWGSSVEDKISGLYVRPALGQNGVGRMIMERLESTIACRGYGSARLASSPNAVEFYRKLGYTEVASGDAYSTPMKKDLQP